MLLCRESEFKIHSHKDTFYSAIFLSFQRIYAWYVLQMVTHILQLCSRTEVSSIAATLAAWDHKEKYL